MAATTAAIIGATAALGGTAIAARGASDARSAANAAANAQAPQVNIAQTDAQARAAALQNAIDSAALEQRFNPGAAQLRQGSLAALLQSLGPNASSALSAFTAQGAPGLSGTGTRPGLSAALQRPELGTVGARPELSAALVRPGASAANTELLARVAAQAGQPLATAGFDSALTRAAVARAAEDLAQGGNLPQDVRNLVARRAMANSGTVTGGLSLSRDLTARDLGLTSLDIRNQRLQNAAALGSQEAGLEQANAALRQQSEQFGRNNLLQSQEALGRQDALTAQNFATDAQIAANRDALASNNFATDAQIQQAMNALLSQNFATDSGLAANRDALAAQNYATDAQIAANRDSQGASNYFNQASLLQNIQNGDFARYFQAAQLGQNIAQPQSGLDPSAIANLAVGNVNSQAGQQQQGFGLRAGAANAQTQFGSQLAGTGLGLMQQYYQPRPVNGTSYSAAGGYYSPPLGGNAASAAAVRGGYP